MSWADVAISGSGAIAFRLVIAGHPLEFVSASSLIGAGTEDRIRIGGLEARSIQWSESLDPAAVKLRAQGFTARIVDDGLHRTGDSFVRQPSRIAYLTASVTSTAVAIPVSNTNTANGDILYLGNECMLITSGGGTAAPTCTRGYRDSIATAHYVDPTLGLSRPEVTFEEVGEYNGRPSIEGSIAYLYAYGDAETGDGTLVWRGIVAAQPKLRDLTVWEVELDSIVSVLDQTLGADLAGPSMLRGINYNAQTAPTLQISILSGDDIDSAIAHTATVGGPDLAGFYETQEEFCDALNALIRTASSTWGTHALNRTSGERPTLIARPGSSGAWTLTYSTPSASHRYCLVDSENGSTTRVDPEFISTLFLRRLSDGVRTDQVSASDSYECQSLSRLDGAGTVPRGFIGEQTDAFTDTVFIGGTLALDVGDTISIEWPAFDGKEAFTRDYYVLAWDSTLRRATVRRRRVHGPRPGVVDRYYTSSSVPNVTTSRSYATSGTLGDFITALTTDSPEYSATGRMPLVTSEHIDPSMTASAIAEIALGRDWLSSRTYLGTSDVSLAKMLEEECKLYGIIPYIRDDGLLAYRQFRVGAATELVAYVVDESSNLSGAQMPGFEPSAFGLLNTIQLKTGFDPKTGKHIGRTFVVRDSAALSRNPLPRLMKIEPRSSWADDLAIPYSEILAMAQTWLGVLGAAYQTITVACRLDAIYATVGQQVSVTVAQLPDTTSGGRGIVLASGVVIGRAVRPLDAIVELTILTTQVRVAGYAPSSLVDTATLVSGSSYDIVLDAIQPTGYALADAWQVGDAAELTQYDAVTPTAVVATITAIDQLTQTVTATLSGAPPAGTLTLEYRGAADVVAQQERYAFIALEDGAGGNVISFASGDVSPRQFAS
jgi:hypothetical protein